MKRQIRLTEEDLHFLVEDTVRNILVENGYDEGALWNAFKKKGNQIGQKMADKAQQYGRDARALGNNMKNTYKAGRNYNYLKKCYSYVEDKLMEFENVAKKIPGCEYIVDVIDEYNEKLYNAVRQAGEYVQQTSDNTFNIRNQEESNEASY